MENDPYIVRLMLLVVIGGLGYGWYRDSQRKSVVIFQLRALLRERGIPDPTIGQDQRKPNELM